MKLSRATLESLSLASFVAFDLETTGLDAVKDEILEIGMVRVEGGSVSARYSQLFQPSIPIPPLITQLTGIRPEDCEGKPRFGEKTREIADFLGSGCLVAHNASFDLSFLSRESFKAKGKAQLDARTIDTLDLSRLLLPYLPNHRLETLAEHCHIVPAGWHRAAEDAATTAMVFLELIREALALPADILKDVLRILHGSNEQIEGLFAAILVMAGTAKRRKVMRGPDNRIGKEPEPEEVKEVRKIMPDDVTRFFKPGGILSGTMPDFEPRKPQIEMATLVARMLNEEAFLLAEAGTGVGKSLAYLVPALLWSERNGHARVIVSTHTKTLQDQLFQKDLPLLMQAMESPFFAVLLKGRNNYICLRRWEHLLLHLESTLSPARRKRLLPLAAWIHETRTGDIEENGGFQREKNIDLWALLASEARFCAGQTCDFRESCYFQRIRKAARAAGLIIVNHSLLFADLVSGKSILGEYDTLFVDEAHQIERVATQTLGISLSYWMFYDLARRLAQPGGREGLVPALEAILPDAVREGEEKEECLGLLDSLRADAADIAAAAGAFFASVAGSMAGIGPEELYSKYRFKSPEALFRDMGKSEALENRLKSLSAHLSGILTSIQAATEGAPSELDPWSREVDSARGQADLLLSHLVHFRTESYEDRIVWCETTAKGPEREAVLYSAPLDIARLLLEMLYPGLRRCMMTSATLSIGESFEYMIGRLGMDGLESERLLKRSFGSPYDFESQVRFLIPTFLSSPKSPGFADEVSRILNEILSVHSRGSMVLFTSYQMLKQVYYALQPHLERRGVRLLGQGISGSRTALLKRFQEDRGSVLLGTSSFWEGVDLPGPALELLVITKLPFDVPTEPLTEAKMEKVEREKGNSFYYYAVPEAVVRLRQGFGRLIRSGSDRGAVLLLDHRVVQTRYGALFLKSIPVQPVICEESSLLMEALKEWFA